MIIIIMVILMIMNMIEELRTRVNDIGLCLIPYNICDNNAMFSYHC